MYFRWHGVVIETNFAEHVSSALMSSTSIDHIKDERSRMHLLLHLSISSPQLTHQCNIMILLLLRWVEG